MEKKVNRKTRSIEMVETEESSIRFRKTKMCKYHASGSCYKGEECSHAHARSELVNKPNLHKTSLCRRWLTSAHCYLNDECPYAHGNQELRVDDDCFSQTPVISPKLVMRSPINRRLSSTADSALTRTSTSDTYHGETMSPSPSGMRSARGRVPDSNDMASSMSTSGLSSRVVDVTPKVCPPVQCFPWLYYHHSMVGSHCSYPPQFYYQSPTSYSYNSSSNGSRSFCPYENETDSSPLHAE